MKRFLIALLLLTACNKTKPFMPACVDGYFVVDLKGDFKGFCTDAYEKEEGIQANDCYDTPGMDHGKGIKARIRMKEGIVMKTECYNIWSEVK